MTDVPVGVWKTYHPRVTTVHAMKMPGAFSVLVPFACDIPDDDSPVEYKTGEAGDYLVEDEAGHFYPLDARTFEREYMPVYHVVTYPEAGMERTRRAHKVLEKEQS